jgi:S-adenosylmethionine hydrolase
MIFLFTDFGLAGPYLGQVEAVLLRAAPGQPVINLFADAPAFDPEAAGYLLAGYAPDLPEGAVVLAVIDPGVGSERLPIALSAEGRWYVGPDNGLLSVVARRAAEPRVWRITWRPQRLSASFHGRDLFAPVAARVARGEAPPGEPMAPGDLVGAGWPDDLPAVVYVDGYGNAMTGLRAAGLAEEALLEAGGRRLERARTFSDLPPGAAFWYENSNGLAEVSVNQGSAAEALGLAVGDAVTVLPGEPGG